MSKLLATKMDFLRRLVGISRMDKVRHIKIKEIMIVEDKPDIIDSTEKKQCYVGMVTSNG
jgi:hypothetical protein